MTSLDASRDRGGFPDVELGVLVRCQIGDVEIDSRYVWFIRLDPF